MAETTETKNQGATTPATQPTAGQAKPAAKPEAPKAPEKQVSVLAEFVKATRDLAADVDSANKKVGGNIARGHADRAVEALRQAADVLEEAVRADA